MQVYLKIAVDSYLTGRAAEMGYTEDGEGAAEELAQEEVKGIRDSIGGDEAYGKMVSWALENLSKPEIEAFNEATNTMSGPQLSMMVQGLYTRYQNAMELNQVCTLEDLLLVDLHLTGQQTEVVAAMSDLVGRKTYLYKKM